MTDSREEQQSSLTDLPPEILEHITNYLPTASAIAGLGRTSKRLHTWVEKDAWKTFSRNAFPSLCPQSALSSYRDAARTLTTVSKAWDKRAFIARHVEPHLPITSYPGGKQLDRWAPPRGQTIGFTPQLDVDEELGSRWGERKETLAFSAGAEVCIRETERGAEESVRWTSYRPHSAFEGRDDVTTLHLLRPEEGRTDASVNFISGTANGDLHMISLPDTASPNQDVSITYFATQGLTVRSSSILRTPDQPTLLAANLDDTKVALYTVDSNQSKIAPSSRIEIHPPLRADGNPAPNHRAWSSTILSSTTLAVGAGPSQDPLHIYSITESGLTQEPVRKFGLQNSLDVLDTLPKAPITSIYTVVPLSASIACHDQGQVFLSGAYDGIVRLHDLRSPRGVEQAYVDPADDSAVYSMLPRGREKLMVGTSRHNLLKVFDMRLGAKCYSYQDIHTSQSPNTGNEACDPESDYNIFLRNNNTSFTTRGSNWSQGRNRSADSSVYSLASAAAHSPYIYAGVESAVYGLAFSEALDPFADPTFFEPWSAQVGPQTSPTQREQTNQNRQQDNDFVNGRFKAENSSTKTSLRIFEAKDVLGLAMYDQGANMKLCVQRSLWETWRAGAPRRRNRQVQGRLDERWKGAAEFGP